MCWVLCGTCWEHILDLFGNIVGTFWEVLGTCLWTCLKKIINISDPKYFLFDIFLNIIFLVESRMLIKKQAKTLVFFSVYGLYGRNSTGVLADPCLQGHGCSYESQNKTEKETINSKPRQGLKPKQSTWKRDMVSKLNQSTLI